MNWRRGPLDLDGWWNRPRFALLVVLVVLGLAGGGPPSGPFPFIGWFLGWVLITWILVATKQGVDRLARRARGSPAD